MEKESALKHFLANINARDVRIGNFSVAFENKKLQPITLNVKCAELISAPPSAFSSTYSNILENVASHSTFPTPLPVALQKALGRSSPVISEFELESEIWRVHWELHLLCRKDPDPRKECLEENRFGLAEKEIGDYLTLADTFHALMLHRYGATGLYPYVVKRVDIVPILLKELPFHSLFRGSTEGGEHSHYLHQCLFYGHSARGGGHIKEDPILTIFNGTTDRSYKEYVQLHWRIRRSLRIMLHQYLLRKVCCLKHVHQSTLKPRLMSSYYFLPNKL